MDEKYLEQASLLEDMDRRRAIAQAQKKEQDSHAIPEGFDGACPRCGEEIPAERLAHMYYVCVPCTAELEHRRRLGIE